MIASSPTLSPAIDAVREYVRTHEPELTTTQVRVLTEVTRRLERLQIQAADLIEINNRLWAKEGMKVELDPDTDTMTILTARGNWMQLKLKRGDPEVPFKICGSNAMDAYIAGVSEPADDEVRMLRIELEEKLESYYQSANKVLTRLGRGGLPGMGKVCCRPISRLRNNLIEHPEQVGAHLYSFGVSSTGPLVKPLYQGKQVFRDEGLIPNTEAFVEALVSACRGQAS